MKRLIPAIAVAAMLAGAAHAQQALTPDTQSLDYTLNGFVDSTCELSTSNGTTRNIDMTRGSPAQGITTLSFSCNSPYTLTAESEFGGFRHDESGGTLNVPYRLRTGGSIGDASTSFRFFTSDVLTSPQTLDSTSNWLSLLSNAGTRSMNLDVLFDDDTFAVAGNYQDVITITLTPNL